MNPAHRVQRVPRTEASGRIHTSTATVIVMPEADEVDVQINQRNYKLTLIVLVERVGNISIKLIQLFV